MSWLYENKYLLALIIILLIVVDRVWYLYKERCPKCKKLGKTSRISEVDLGNISSKIRVVRKCNNCKYVWANIEEDPKGETPG